MRADDRARRDAEVVRARARGLGWSRIAEHHGISDRQARRIVADYRDRQPSLDGIDPSDVIRDTLDAYDAVIDELVTFADETQHDASKVGASRQRLDAFKAKVELLQAVGVLPHDLGEVRLVEDAQAVAQTIVTVFERHGIPKEVQEEIAEIIEHEQPYQG
jgi:hypothetical protein